MAAAGAEAVKLKPVGGDGEFVFAGHFFLQPFDFFVFKFHDLLATGADEVIVVALVRDIVVLRLGAEVAGLRQACIAKQVERSVDGGEPQVRIRLGQLVIHGFCRNMFLAKKRAQDQFPLAGEFELMLAQVLLERLHFLHMRIRHIDSLRTDSIKDETSPTGQGGVELEQRRRRGIDGDLPRCL